jgi:uncharacterized protein
LQLSDSISPVSPPPPAISSASGENPAWNLLDVLAIVGFALLSLVITLPATLAVAHSLPHFHNFKYADLAENALVVVPAQVAAYVLVIGFMVQIVRLKVRESFLTAVSWNAPPVDRIFLALLGGGGMALLSNVFTGLLAKWTPKSLPIDKMYHDTSSVYMLACFGIAVAPFVEELFFRGFLYPALARRIGASPSVALTAAGFAVVHQGQLAHAWVPLAWLFVVGTVLTVVRAKTKSVATCVLIHLGYNATLFAFLFIATHGFHQLDQN